MCKFLARSIIIQLKVVHTFRISENFHPPAEHGSQHCVMFRKCPNSGVVERTTHIELDILGWASLNDSPVIPGHFGYNWWIFLVIVQSNAAPASLWLLHTVSQFNQI